MAIRTDLVYEYDGTLDGFLCCVFQCFQNRELPVAIQPPEQEQETLYPRRRIPTVPEQADRVRRSIPNKMSPEAWELVRDAFLTCLPEKEMKMLRFLLFGYRVGPQVTRLLADDRVHVLNQAVLKAHSEAHLLLGFLRFSDLGGVLAAEIAPKNQVLPLIAAHFCERFSGENFMIWDKVHRVGLLHRNTGEYRFFEADAVQLPPAGEEERICRALWKQFYHTIAIEERANPRCRRTHMPKRYWAEMTEVRELV